MNIPELRLKVKDVIDRLNTKEIYTVLLILVVGFGSFGLGRLSKLQEARVPIRIEQTSAAVLSANLSLLSKEGTRRVVVSSVKDKGLTMKDSATPAAGCLPAEALAKAGQLVAAKTGTKYYFPWCSGAARISEANKIRFASAEEARKAGYTPAANCKGLK